MAVTVRQADIEELHSVNARIEEFRTPYPIEVFQARLMLHAQETWVSEHGYLEIRVKSRNRYRNMLMLLLSEGYQVFDIEPQEQLEDNRIWFQKTLTS